MNSNIQTHQAKEQLHNIRQLLEKSKTNNHVLYITYKTLTSSPIADIFQNMLEREKHTDAGIAQV